MFFFIAISALLAAAAAQQQCQASGRPCSLTTSGSVSATVGVCVVTASSQVGTCVAQCREANTVGCFLTTQSSTQDGVCQISNMSTTATCVAKQSQPPPAAACTIDRPCSTSANAVGLCTSVNGAATCKAQCTITPGTTQQTACFRSLMSQTRDGVCNSDAVCAEMPVVTTCQAGARCRLTAAGSNTVEVGVCRDNACAKQCQTTQGMVLGSTACYTSFNGDATDGVCDGGVCKAKSTMVQGCVNVNDACTNANGVAGKCAKTDSNALSCVVLTACNSLTANGQCTYINADGFVKPGVCSQQGCAPQPAMCQLGAAGTACKTADGVDGKVSAQCACVKNEVTPVQQCSSSTEGLKCQAPSSSPNTVVTYGTCKQGRCDTGSTQPTCQTGAACKTADGADGKLGGDACTCIKNEVTPTPVQQCSANTEGAKCWLTAAGTNSMSTTGTCKASQCVSGDQVPQCKAGDACKTAAGVAGTFNDGCRECVVRSDPNAQCQKDGDSCQLSTPGTNTMSAGGVCKGGQCVAREQPQCKAGDACKTAAGVAGTFNDGCRECVVRSDPNAKCQADGDKCTLASPGSNTMTATGVCKGGQCVSGGDQPQPTKPCTNGAFCEPAAGQRGFCRNQVCESVKCMSDDNCLSSDSTTKRVCLAYQCVPAPTTMTNPCSANIKCENGGKCVVVQGANAGFTDAQLKQSADIAATYNGLAGVCVCADGFKGATCEIKVEEPTEKPASCLCGNGMVSRDNLCVQTSIKTCDCNKNCLCTNDSSDQCTQPEKKPPTMNIPGGSNVLQVLFTSNSNLLQALGTVQALLEKYNSVQVTAEKTEVGLRVTVVVKGDIDPALVDSVKAAAASLRMRNDVVDAVVQDVEIVVKDTAVADSASSLAIGASMLVVAVVAMN